MGDSGIVSLRQKPSLKVHYSTSKNKYNLAVLIIKQLCILDGKNVKYSHFKSGQK